MTTTCASTFSRDYASANWRGQIQPFLVESRSNGDDKVLKSSILNALTKRRGERN